MYAFRECVHLYGSFCHWGKKTTTTTQITTKTRFVEQDESKWLLRYHTAS